MQQNRDDGAVPAVVSKTDQFFLRFDLPAGLVVRTGSPFDREKQDGWPSGPTDQPTNLPMDQPFI